MGRALNAITRFEALRTDPALIEALHRLDDSDPGAGVTFTPLPTTSFVAPGGNDATAVRGQIEKPFLTIAAAVAAAASGDTIYIAPGTYNESVVVPPTKAINFQGASRDSTVLTQAAAPCISWAPTTLFPAIQIDNLQVNRTGGGSAIAIDCSAGQADVILSRIEVLIGDLTVTGSIAPVTIDNVNVQSGTLAIAANQDVTMSRTTARVLSVVNCGTVFGYDSLFRTTSSIGYDSTISGIPGRGRYVFNGCQFTGTRGVVVMGHPLLSFGRECLITGSDGDAIDATGLTFNSANNEAPQIVVTAMCAGACVFTYPFIDNAPATQSLDLSHGHFLDPVTVQKAAVDGRGRLSAIARNAVFDGAVTAGESTDLDIRQSFYVSGNLASTGAGGSVGTIDREGDVFTGTAGGAGVLDIPITVPYPTDAILQGFANADAAGAIANVTNPLTHTGPIAVNVSAASGVEVRVSSVLH